jgi:hypothetical protein
MSEQHYYLKENNSMPEQHYYLKENNSMPEQLNIISNWMQDLIMAVKVSGLKTNHRFFLIEVAKEPIQSAEDLAKKLECHRATVFRITAWLKSKDFLVIQHRWKKQKNGSWGKIPNEYHINDSMLEKYLPAGELLRIKKRNEERKKMDLVEAHTCKNSYLVEAHASQNATSSYRHQVLSKIPGHRLMNKESFISQTVDESKHEPGILDIKKEEKKMDLVEAHASQNSNLVEAHASQNATSSYRHQILSKIPGHRLMNKESFISQTVDEPKHEPGILDIKKEEKKMDLVEAHTCKNATFYKKDDILTKSQQLCVDKLDFQHKSSYDELVKWGIKKAYALKILMEHDLAKVTSVMERAKNKSNEREVIRPYFLVCWKNELENKPMSKYSLNSEQLKIERDLIDIERRKAYEVLEEQKRFLPTPEELSEQKIKSKAVLDAIKETRRIKKEKESAANKARLLIIYANINPLPEKSIIRADYERSLLRPVNNEDYLKDSDKLDRCRNNMFS